MAAAFPKLKTITVAIVALLNDIYDLLVVVDGKIDQALGDLLTIDGKCDTIITDVGTVDGKIDAVAGDVGDVYDEVESSSLNAGAGSAANKTRLGALVRRIADAFGVPAKDSIANVSINDVIGNKTDAIGHTSLVGLSKRVENSTNMAGKNSSANNYINEAIGNKTDDAVTVPDNTSTALAYLKGILGLKISEISRIDFVSEPKDEIIIGTVPATVNLNNLVIPAGSIPAGSTIVRVNSWISFDSSEDSSGSNNRISAGAMEIKKSTDGSWVGCGGAMGYYRFNKTPANSIRGISLCRSDTDSKAAMTALSGTFNGRLITLASLGNALVVDGVEWGIEVYFTR